MEIQVDINDQKKASFICSHQGCDKSFPNMRRLKKHVVYHSDQRPFGCGEDTCDKTFLTKAHLKRHMVKVHSKGERLSENARKIHHVCHVCDKEFKKGFQLKIHSAVHSGQKAHKCETCGETFVLKGRLNRHLKKHHTIYECSVDGCAFSCDKWTSLRKHMVVHRLKCHLCNSSFASETRLNNHLAKHRVNLRCPLCELCYSRKSNLKTHIRTVHEKVTYRCSLESCGKELAHKKSLRHHMKLHAKEGQKAPNTTSPAIKTGSKPREIKRKSLFAEKLTGYKPEPDQKEELLLADKAFRIMTTASGPINQFA